MAADQVGESGVGEVEIGGVKYGVDLSTVQPATLPRNNLWRGEMPVEPLSMTSLAARLGPGNHRRLAKKSGLSRCHVIRSLRGLRYMSFHVAKRIADAANVTLDDLYRFISANPNYHPRVRRSSHPKAKPRPTALPHPSSESLVAFSHRQSVAERHKAYLRNLNRRAKGTAVEG